MSKSIIVSWVGLCSIWIGGCLTTFVPFPFFVNILHDTIALLLRCHSWVTHAATLTFYIAFSADSFVLWFYLRIYSCHIAALLLSYPQPEYLLHTPLYN